MNKYGYIILWYYKKHINNEIKDLGIKEEECLEWDGYSERIFELNTSHEGKKEQIVETSCWR